MIEAPNSALSARDVIEANWRESNAYRVQQDVLPQLGVTPSPEYGLDAVSHDAAHAAAIVKETP